MALAASLLGTAAGCDGGILSMLQKDVSRVVDPPRISPPGGTSSQSVLVVLATPTPEASIRYTLDGTRPDADHGILYAGEFAVPGCTCLRAVAYKDGFTTSTESSAAFHVYRAVDSADDVGQYASLALSGQTLYIAYYDAANSALKLAKSLDWGESWSKAFVEETGSVGQYASLHASQPILHIGYYDAANQNLKLAKSLDDGQSWALQVIDGDGVGAGAGAVNGDAGKFCSLDRSGDELYLSYLLDGGTLRLAAYHSATSSWSLSSLDTSGNTVGEACLDADEYNGISVVYNDLTAMSLVFLRSANAGQTWDPPLAVDSGEGYSGLDLLVYAAPKILEARVSYVGTAIGPAQLRYASLLKTQPWTAATVDSGSEGCTSLLLLGARLVLASFRPTSYVTGELRVSDSEDAGATWVNHPSDASGLSGIRCSAAASSTEIYIAYYDSAGRNLKFLRSLDGRTW